jgi:maltose alpha-D-glucosyltransferase / alpha-amylase
MLRSFDRVARSAISNLGVERAERLETLEPLAHRWKIRARDSFREGYSEGARGSASYPENEEQARALVDLFVLEKALHELQEVLEDHPDRAVQAVDVLVELLQDAAVEGRT